MELIFIPIVIGVYLLPIIFVIYCTFRIIRALERIADATERIAIQ